MTTKSNNELMLDSSDSSDYNIICDVDLEMTMAPTVDDEINELASMLASIGMTDDVDDEAEAVLDMLYAEHTIRMNAASSYDNDASYYGEII